MNGILFKSILCIFSLVHIAGTNVCSGQEIWPQYGVEATGVVQPATYYEPSVPTDFGAGSGQALPARYPYVIARPADRAWIESQPIHMRPDRPLHIYGNFVRRVYDRNPSTILAQENLLQIQPLSSGPIGRFRR
ncbi:MAG: hypothetical protein AAF456_03330 [Planctomycetota bacterium]